MVRFTRKQRRIALGLWFVVFALVFVSQSLVTIAPVSTIWAEGSKKDLPDRIFRVAAFPRGDAARLYDSDEVTSGYLDRAIFVSLDEWNSDGPIGVFTSATEVMFVDRANLALDVASEDDSDRWTEVARVFSVSTFDPQLDAVERFDYFSAKPGEHRVNAYMANGDINTSDYRTEGEIVIPLRVTLTSASAPRDIPPLPAALHGVLLATASVAVYWLTTAVRAWRLRPRPPQAAA